MTPELDAVGVAVTTRNRPLHLAACLERLARYAAPSTQARIVVDDASDTEAAALNEACALCHGFGYLRHEEQQGVAASKNDCLRALAGCTHLFLFDDDCFPIAEGWERTFIEPARASGCQHLFLSPYDAAAPVRDGVMSLDRWWGVLLYLTAEVLATVGAFEEHFGMYGGEHASYSWRAHQGGLMGAHGPWAAPVAAVTAFYAQDFARLQGLPEGLYGLPHVRTMPTRQAMLDSERESTILLEATRAVGLVGVPLDAVPRTFAQFLAYAASVGPRPVVRYERMAGSMFPS